MKEKAFRQLMWASLALIGMSWLLLLNLPDNPPALTWGGLAGAMAPWAGGTLLFIYGVIARWRWKRDEPVFPRSLFGDDK